ncbi:MAG: sulfite exporter TauE/SafE family protein [Anaerolineae bacterium]
MLLLALFVIAAVIGLLGSMLGIGGGVLIIPVLTLFFGIPIKVAIGASIISVVATSSAAGAVYVGHGLSNTKLAMVLEIATTLGALAGGLTAAFLAPRVLQALFGLVLLYVIYSMSRLPKEEADSRPTGLMDASYVDPLTGRTVVYGVRRLPFGMGASLIAGNISGLLGIGGGIIKVPIMSLVMGMPLRSAIATSNFMIGVTAATSALIYYSRGYIDPQIAIPTALGVLLGARFGPHIGGRLQGTTLKRVFQVLLIVFAIQMLYQAVRG